MKTIGIFSLTAILLLSATIQANAFTGKPERIKAAHTILSYPAKLAEATVTDLKQEIALSEAEEAKLLNIYSEIYAFEIIGTGWNAATGLKEELALSDYETAKLAMIYSELHAFELLENSKEDIVLQPDLQISSVKTM